LAETASVFGEMLTFKKLLAATTTRKSARRMLAGKVEDMINTVVRQIAFYTFERAVHTERKNGELTAERIGEIWLSVQRREPGSGDRYPARLRDVSGPISRTSSIRRSTSTPMRSAIAW
jgi:oligoendopeptidase F